MPNALQFRFAVRRFFRRRERSNSRGMRSNRRAGLARFCIGRRNILTIQRVFIARGTLKAFTSNEPSSVLAFRFGAPIRRCNATRECSFNFHKLFPIIIKHASYHDCHAHCHARTMATRRRPRRPKRREKKSPVASLISRLELFEDTSRWRISFPVVASRSDRLLLLPYRTARARRP